MEFTKSCFIRKNTPELRKKLEEFGYNILDSNYRTLEGKPIDEGSAIITYEYYNYYAVVCKVDNVVKAGRIDCNKNEDLFLAIATLCKNNSKWYLLQEKNSFSILYKITPTELIKYFKNNKYNI